MKFANTKHVTVRQTVARESSIEVITSELPTAHFKSRVEAHLGGDVGEDVLERLAPVLNKVGIKRIALKRVEAAAQSRVMVDGETATFTSSSREPADYVGTLLNTLGKEAAKRSGKRFEELRHEAKIPYLIASEPADDESFAAIASFNAGAGRTDDESRPDDALAEFNRRHRNRQAIERAA